MTSRETNPNFMNGVPELLILRLLEDGEMYGYEIVQALRERTDAVIAVGEGVVYPVLHALEQGGALKSRRKTVAGRNRIYYSVTKAGSRRLTELTARWTELAGAIQRTLAGTGAGGRYGEAVS
jgi:PadR family transcriptional regulator